MDIILSHRVTCPRATQLQTIYRQKKRNFRLMWWESASMAVIFWGSNERRWWKMESLTLMKLPGLPALTDTSWCLKLAERCFSLEVWRDGTCALMTAHSQTSHHLLIAPAAPPRSSWPTGSLTALTWDPLLLHTAAVTHSWWEQAVLSVGFLTSATSDPPTGVQAEAPLVAWIITKLTPSPCGEP